MYIKISNCAQVVHVWICMCLIRGECYSHTFFLILLTIIYDNNDLLSLITICRAYSICPPGRPLRNTAIRIRHQLSVVAAALRAGLYDTTSLYGHSDNHMFKSCNYRINVKDLKLRKKIYGKYLKTFQFVIIVCV